MANKKTKYIFRGANLPNNVLSEFINKLNFGKKFIITEFFSTTLNEEVA